MSKSTACRRPLFLSVSIRYEYTRHRNAADRRPGRRETTTTAVCAGQQVARHPVTALVVVLTEPPTALWKQ
jgi:hypothetical protein